MDVAAQLDPLVAALKSASWTDREAKKDALLEAVRGIGRIEAEPYLYAVRKTLPLELRWEIDEIVEAIQPPPEPEPEPEPEDDAPPDGQLRMSDLNEVYADPRGLALYTDKSGQRWFASQPDPYTGQPMMMELPPADVERVKVQLKGSPYWRIGSGVVP